MGLIQIYLIIGAVIATIDHLAWFSDPLDPTLREMMDDLSFLRFAAIIVSGWPIQLFCWPVLIYNSILDYIYPQD